MYMYIICFLSINLWRSQIGHPLPFLEILELFEKIQVKWSEMKWKNLNK